MINRILEGAYPGVKLSHVRMQFSNEVDEIGKIKLAKIKELFRILFRVWNQRLRGARILYYPPAGPNFVPAVRDILLLIPTRFLFRATIFHFHASGISELIARSTGLKRILLQLAYHRPEVAIRLSKSTSNDARAIEAKREVIIPYGIPDEAPERKGGIAERRGTLTLLFVAVMREDKGIFVLIESCNELKRRGFEFKVKCVGRFFSSEIEAKANRMLREFGLEDWFEFPGVLTGDSKLNAFRSSDIFCFPTYYASEAFPVVLLEALSFALPIVSTCWRGVPDLVNEECAILVEPRNVPAITDALQLLLSDPELRERMSKASRKRYEAEFTIEQFHERVGALFRSI